MCIRDRLYTVAINRIFEGIGTLVGKCLYVDNHMLFYSAKAMAMRNGKQGAIVTLVENTNVRLFSLGNKDNLYPLLLKVRQASGLDANHKWCPVMTLLI